MIECSKENGENYQKKMLFERKKTEETSVFEQLALESMTSKLIGVTGRLYQEGNKRRRRQKRKRNRRRLFTFSINMK